METSANPIDQACIAVGSARELARRLKVAAPTVSEWANGFDDVTGLPRDLATLRPGSKWRPVPKERCPAIELLTVGQVRVERLRADQRWERVPDPNWPHPQGRPCIDVVGPAEEARHAA